ncbi:hypothetical protein [Marivirga lumbricoides]
MKIAKLIRYAFCILIMVSYGCEDDLEPFTINAPADLQARIDSIAAAKAAQNTGDTTFIEISTAIVGEEDFSSPWWTDFSDYFAVPPGKKLTLEFINHNGGSPDNFKNWVLLVSNEAGDREAESYSEYFALRSDAYGWGNGDFDIGVISTNYASNLESDPTDEDWANFRAIMDGAHVTLEIDHSSSGYAFITGTAVGTDGTELVITYNQPVSATAAINVFLVAEGSYFEMEEAYLVPSQVTEIADANPVSLDITGTPAMVEIGSEDFWGNAVATVTYDDGSSSEIDSADLSFNVIPDLTTVGEKTVLVAYNKTKQGVFTKSVSDFYTLNVVNAITGLEVSTLPDITTYYFFDSDSIVFNPKGMVVTATYADGSSGTLDNVNLEFDSIAAVAGAQNVGIAYEGATSIVTTTCPITLVQGNSQVGASNFSTPWWLEFSNDFTVSSGESKMFEMYCYSAGNLPYQSPSTILRRADNSAEYAVTRMDNFGWGDGYSTATLSNDWVTNSEGFDVEFFNSNISGSHIIITVTNNGDDTADIRYDVTYANGDTHFQEYTGITVDSTDLNCTLVIEGAYIVLLN